MPSGSRAITAFLWAKIMKDPTNQREGLPLARLSRHTDSQLVQQILREKLNELYQPPVPTEQEKTDVFSEETLYLKIRQLVENQAPWQLIEPACTALLVKNDSAENQAYVIGEAMLSGGVTSACEVFAKFSEPKPQFYLFLHNEIREKLALHLWSNQLLTDLGFLLLCAVDDVLTHNEKILKFLLIVEQEQYQEAYLFSRRYGQELLSIPQNLQNADTEISNKVAFALAKVCFETLKFKEGFDHIRRVSLDSPLYAGSLNILISGKKKQDLVRKSPIGSRILSQENPEKRLAVLDEVLGHFAAQEIKTDYDRIVLNLTLGDLDQFFPAKPSVWQDLARLLLKWFSLSPHLLNIDAFFRIKMRSLYSPALERGLWETVVSATVDAPSRFWQSVAQLHLYLVCPKLDATLLWASRRTLLALADSNISWDELLDWAVEEVKGSDYILEECRSGFVMQLLAARSSGQFDVNALSGYVTRFGPPPVDVLGEWIDFTFVKRHRSLCLDFLVKYAENAHLRNQDLKKWIVLAYEAGRHDLAYRAGTLLVGRKACPKKFYGLWAISGENRDLYPLVLPTHQEFKSVFSGFSDSARKLLSSLYLLAPQLAQLQQILNKEIVSSKMPTPATRDPEYRIFEFMRSSWGNGGRRYALRHQDAICAFGCEIPKFIAYVPANDWSILLLKISNWLGFHLWNWERTELMAVLQSLRVERDGKASSRLSKWKRNLNLREKTALNQLSRVLMAMSDQECFLALASFLCRLTTLLYPHHLQALTSLREMRTHIALIWDLERWILSDDYSEIRKLRKIVCRVPIPHGFELEDI